MNWAIYRFPKLLTWNWSASTSCLLTALSQKSVFSRSALGKQVDFVTTREQTPRTSRYPGLPGSRAISRQLLQTDCQAGPPAEQEWASAPPLPRALGSGRSGQPPGARVSNSSQRGSAAASGTLCHEEPAAPKCPAGARVVGTTVWGGRPGEVKGGGSRTLT